MITHPKSLILHRRVTSCEVERILVVNEGTFFDVTYNFPTNVKREAIQAVAFNRRLTEWKEKGFVEV